MSFATYAYALSAFVGIRLTSPFASGSLEPSGQILFSNLLDFVKSIYASFSRVTSDPYRSMLKAFIP